MARPVVANVGQQRWDGAPSSRVHSVGTRSFAPPRGLARQGLGRLLRLTDLLGRDLVVHSALPTCLVGTWSSASPRRLARRGLGPLFRLADLLSGDLVVHLTLQTCSANGSERGYGPYLGYSIPRYPTVSIRHIQTISTDVGQVFLQLVPPLAYHVYHHSELGPFLYDHKSNITYAFPQHLNVEQFNFL
jgi:hypothetical protein